MVDPDGALGSASLQTDDYIWDGDELVGVTGYNSLVFASGPAPDMVLFESATTLHTLLGDHQNTVRDLISTSGTVENHLVYNSYGELKSQTGGGAYSPFHRFTGKPFDVAVGLQYNINRWYDPATGRWISEDPIGFGGGHANLNVYVGNGPVHGLDPYGLQGVTQPRTRDSNLGGGEWVDTYRPAPNDRGEPSPQEQFKHYFPDFESYGPIRKFLSQLDFATGGPQYREWREDVRDSISETPVIGTVADFLNDSVERTGGIGLGGISVPAGGLPGGGGRGIGVMPNRGG